MSVRLIDTPLGRVAAILEDSEIISLKFEGEGTESLNYTPPCDVMKRLEEAISRYLLGSTEKIEVPVAIRGTAFQRKVWNEVTNIPFGETRTYAQVAKAIGRPTAVRAVAAAIGQNKLLLVIPCHRVIGANGQLTGYSGGLERKRWLLAHERSTSKASANNTLFGALEL